MVRQIPLQAVPGQAGKRIYTGLAPNGMALAPAGHTLFVSEGGANAVAVVDLATQPQAVVAQIPTGWYPHSVSLSQNGKYLYIANSKSDPGPDPKSIKGAFNQYVEQREQAGLLTIPVPGCRPIHGAERAGERQ